MPEHLRALLGVAAAALAGVCGLVALGLGVYVLTAAYEEDSIRPLAMGVVPFVGLTWMASKCYDLATKCGIIGDRS